MGKGVFLRLRRKKITRIIKKPVGLAATTQYDAKVCYCGGFAATITHDTSYKE
jgi:hypothetical protein